MLLPLRQKVTGDTLSGGAGCDSPGQSRPMPPRLPVQPTSHPQRGLAVACLFRDLQQRGYPGSYGPAASYARRLRQAQGLSPGQHRPQQSLPSVFESPGQPLTPRRATWLVLRRETKRIEAEAQQLAQLQLRSYFVRILFKNVLDNHQLDVHLYIEFPYMLCR